MKTVLLVLIILFTVNANAQEKAKDSLIWKPRETCEKGNADAKQDFDKAIYNSYSYGFLVIRTPKKSEIGFDEFFVDYMKKKYSINMEHRGCVISEYSSCYSETMDNLISIKFGNDIFKRGRKEAKKLFKKNNGRQRS